MEYKGYAASSIDFDPEDKAFSGTAAGLRDVIHFEGRTATELERAFRESIVRYLELCAETSQRPDRPSTERSWYAPNRSCTVKRPCARQSKA
jgi:predicted HicB family RNase H-like nuclease